jgi:uncharacterized protein (DUF2147 family)
MTHLISRSLFIVWMCIHNTAIAEDDLILGLWRAIDNNNAATTSVIELYLDGPLLNGRIFKLLDENGREISPICERCTGGQKGKPIVGMTFISGLKRTGTKWVDGKVVDLRPGALQGITANCEIENIGDKVRLYGYLGMRILGRESIWIREKS